MGSVEKGRPLPQVLAITSLFCKDTKLSSIYNNNYVKNSKSKEKNSIFAKNIKKKIKTS